MHAGTNSVGGASVSPHFNFTRAAELAAAHAREAAAADSADPPASANAVNNREQPVEAAIVSTQPPAKPKKKKAKHKAAAAAAEEEDDDEGGITPGGGYVTVEYEGDGGSEADLAPPPDALGFVATADPDLAGLGRPPPAAAASPSAPITNELLDPTLLSGTRGPAMRSPLGSGATGPPGPLPPVAARVPRVGQGLPAVAIPQKPPGGVVGAAAAVRSPDDWVVNITAPDFRGGAHIAKRQARHYHSLPGSLTPECQQRLLAIVRHVSPLLLEIFTVPVALLSSVSVEQ
jgi:hypothetical protein